ncbi:sigma-54 interaction domain-containing protein [Thermoanaerobacterium sp. DL9XJH110]|uniref:sigma-54 interaction domain-containing protein n=1 Tax=Thermoanaerobacterium sp. DL9XJH110 TaxID=3386643 RepID=UPI003BB67035
MASVEEKLEDILKLETVREIFDTLEEGVLIVDRDCRILFYNKTLSNFEGLDPIFVVGKTIFEVFPSITPQESTLFQVIKTGKSVAGRYQQYFNCRGKQIKTVNTTIPITCGGEVIGAAEVSRDVSMIINLTERVADLQQKSTGTSKHQKKYAGRYSFDDILGHNEKIRKIIEMLKKVSMTSSSVLIYGETGTGKELFAQSIHNASPRRHMPFIAQNCAAIPESILEGLLFGTTRGSFTGALDKPGLFEQADGGTMLLDEINSMPISLQSKLLRVLQEGVIRRVGGSQDIPVDVRIIATTNENPIELTKNGKLRQDLFYRLSVIYVEIPPLRERPDDISELAEFFIKKYNEKFHRKVTGINWEVMDIFRGYSWPGNVRELENVIEALMNYVDYGEIRKEHLQFLSFGPFKNYLNEQHYSSENPEFKGIINDYQKKVILDVLRSTGANITKAAKKMGIKRQLLQYYMKKYNISREEVLKS